MSRLMAYALVAITIVFTTLGQILIKWEARRASDIPASWSARYVFFIHLLTNPIILCGLFSAVIAACAWIIAMTKLPITVAYPMMSLTYPLVIGLGWTFFGETVSVWRILSMLLILVGVALLGMQ
jgi:multidrug transporter EmrE-like cation transporter